jgi:hypothetical protein
VRKQAPGPVASCLRIALSADQAAVSLTAGLDSPALAKRRASKAQSSRTRLINPVPLRRSADVMPAGEPRLGGESHRPIHAVELGSGAGLPGVGSPHVPSQGPPAQQVVNEPKMSS